MEAIVFIIPHIYFVTRSVRARDAITPIARERKYLMDYKYR